MRESIIYLLFLTCFLACSDVTGENGDNQNRESVVSIDLRPDSIYMATGDSTQLSINVILSDDTYAEDHEITWYIEDTSIVRMDTNLVLVGVGAGHTVLQASIDTLFDAINIEIYDRSLRGRVRLQNQINHEAIMVGWLPLGEEYVYGGHNMDYVLTDSLGYYVLPYLEDGDWVFTIEYPYYSRGRDTVTVVDGKPVRPIRDFYLTQLLSFGVVLDKTEYSINDTIWVKFSATNLTDSTLRFISRNYRIWSDGYAMAQDAVPVIVDWHSGKQYGVVFHSTGAPAFDTRVFLPGQTIIEDAADANDVEKMSIPLPWFYEKGGLKIGETYEIYAGYIADWTYPHQYFWDVWYWDDEPRYRAMNLSLYKKLDPVLITITE